MSDTNGNLKWAIDMITLYDPGFWGVDDFNKFYDNSVLSPHDFWDRALDTVASTGIQGIEVTFGPGHYKNALERYGSAEKFQAALSSRSLEVCSGFYTGLVLGGDWQDEQRQKEIYEEVADYADFLAAAGSDIMVAGLPMRTSWDAEPPVFVNHDYASRLADVINRMGYVCAKRGVRLAIHPETHAVFWLKRDIDLFMLLTDPVYVGFCPDTAHLTTGGGDATEIVRQHRGRVIIAHWKDALSGVPVKYPIDENIFRSHHPFFARVGTGEVDWPAWTRMLRDTGYQGWAIIELDAAANPPETIRAAKAYVDATLRPIYS